LRKRPQAQDRPHWPQPSVPQRARVKKRGFMAEHGPAIFGAAILIASFGFAGHIIGKNAVAHNAEVEDVKFLAPPPALIESNIATKGSLLPEGMNFDIVNLKVAREQSIEHVGKGDLALEQPVDEVPAPLPLSSPVAAPHEKAIASITPASTIRIEPAALNIKEENGKAVKRLALTPKPSKIEKEFKLSKTEKQKVVAQRRVRLAEENCLARAIYFEARSESDLGQMAVAKVVLNRTRTEGFPKTICGVVYQGSNRRNSCQFSFACDGLPDDVRQPDAWSRARRIAQKAIAGSHQMGSGMHKAVNYHADYVKPKWSKTMRRLVKIGRHIFYADG
jgi:spore germination cell wall hydrolase CwlJ-like protein